nr:hypothetical protein [Tanacetum cinerariifolium]
EYEYSSLALECERRDEKQRFDHLKQDLRMLVIKRFRERKKIFRERKLSKNFVLREDCMMVVKEIKNGLLEEVDKLKWWFEQDIDDEGEEDKEDGGCDEE